MFNEYQRLVKLSADQPWIGVPQLVFFVVRVGFIYFIGADWVLQRMDDAGEQPEVLDELAQLRQSADP